MIRLSHLVVEDFKTLRSVRLAFPRNGAVLVEGLNESGKSTLFESVFFALYGRPLLSESGIESTIRYGAQESHVELGLTVDATELLIQRHTRLTRNTARLVIRHPDGSEEELTQLRAISARIVAELGGLEADTLLNSCFVEQKKLERLEKLTAADRRASLLRLLNLERLGEMEDHFKLTRADDEELRRAHARAELAELRARIPPAESALEQVNRRILAWHVRESMAAITRDAHELTEQRARQKALDDERQELRSRLEHAERLREAEHLAERLQERQRKYAAAEERIQPLEAQLRALETLEREALPADQLRGETLRRVAFELESAEADASRAQSAVEATRRLLVSTQETTVAEGAVAQARQAAEAADRALRTAEQTLNEVRASNKPIVAQALRAWIEAREELEQVEAAAGDEAAARAAVERRRAQVQAAGEQHGRAGSGTPWLLAGGVAALAGVGLSTIGWTAIGLALLLIAVVAIGAGIRARGASGTARAAALEQARAALLDDERLLAAVATSTAAVAACRKRVLDAERFLASAGEPIPPSLAAAAARLDRSTAEAGGDLGQQEAQARQEVERLQQASRHALENAAAAEAHLAQVRAASEQARQQVMAPGLDPQALSLEAVQQLRAAAEQRLEDARLQAASLAETATPQGLREAAARVEERIDEASRKVAGIPRLRADLAEVEALRDALRTDMDGDHESLARQAASLGHPLLDDLEAFLATLRQAREQLADAETRRRLGEVDEERGQVQARIAQLEQAIAEQQEAVRIRLEPLGVLLTDPPEWQEILVHLPEASATDLPDLGALEQQRDQQRTDLTVTRARVRGLEEQHNLEGVPLNPEETAAELAQRKRRRDIKVRATQIIGNAKASLVQKVLPSTEQHLQLLLPELTSQRYFDARIAAEDFHLRVWDSAARRFVSKEIFSGGTKDQFSLALRLAFALATLPQEIGTSPGFIFLDEPLSAFDEPRTLALIDLLTTGIIARSFEQIFLISHSRAFPSDRFPYYVRMEDGRVAETNLSQAPSTRVLVA